MTSMEQIELISVEARKLGMKYGEYVEKYGHTLPEPKPEKKKGTGYIEGEGDRGHLSRIDKVCIICGASFKAGNNRAKHCPKCTEDRRRTYCREYARQKKRESENLVKVRNDEKHDERRKVDELEKSKH